MSKFEFNGVGVQELDELKEEVSRIEALLEGLPDKFEKLEKAKLGAAAFHDEPTGQIHQEIKELKRRKQELEAKKWFIEKNVIPSLERENERSGDLRDELKEKDRDLFEAVDEENWQEALELADKVAKLLKKLSDILPKGKFAELDHGESYSRWNGSYEKFQGEERLGYWAKLNNKEIPFDFTEEDFSSFDNSVRRDLYKGKEGKWLIFFGIKSDKRKVKDLKKNSYPYPLDEQDKEKISEWEMSDRSAKEKVREKFLGPESAQARDS